MRPRVSTVPVLFKLYLQTVSIKPYLQKQAGLITPMAYQSLKAPQSRSEKESPDLPPHQQMGVLTFAEKKFLLAVERGDVASSRR